MDSILLIVAIILFSGLANTVSRKNRRSGENRSAVGPKADPPKAKGYDVNKAIQEILDNAPTKEVRAAAEAAKAARAAMARAKTAAPEGGTPAPAQPADALQTSMFEGMEGSLPYSAMGESFIDDEGCIGGSLGEHTEEGESGAEHAEHLRRADEQAEGRLTASRTGISAAKLRRAVIMSEILDKPKALRAKRI